MIIIIFLNNIINKLIIFLIKIILLILIMHIDPCVNLYVDIFVGKYVYVDKYVGMKVRDELLKYVV